MKECALPMFYSKVLSQFASGKNSEERYLNELVEVKEVLDANKNLNKALSSSLLSKTQKQNILKRLFGENIDRHVLFFLQKLVAGNKLSLLSSIIQEFSKQLRKKNGLLDVKLIVAVPSSDEDKKALKEKIASTCGRQVQIHEKVDNRILGGMILLFADNKMLDYSLKSKLEHLQESLSKGNEYAIES